MDSAVTQAWLYIHDFQDGDYIDGERDEGDKDDDDEGNDEEQVRINMLFNFVSCHTSHANPHTGHS